MAGGTGKRECRRIERTGGDFPPCLLDARPEVEAVWLCGRLPPPPRIALVGSRKPDDYGFEMAARLGEGLAKAGVCVVSGGAAGVDTAALQAALDAGGQVVAVLGTGCDIDYPAANRQLFDRIASAGALLSEHAPGTAGRPGNFALRNRIISALSEAVVVVRAAARSGSLITASYARRQGRQLMAVPGPAGEELSAGCHELLKKGALLVESAGDILSAIGVAAESHQTGFDLNTARQLEQELDERQKALCDVLRGGQASVDEIARRSGMSSSAVSAAMLELEIMGIVRQLPGMVYRLASEHAQLQRGKGVSG